MKTANHDPSALDADPSDALPAWMTERQRSRVLERKLREAAALLRSALSSDDPHHLRTVAGLALKVLDGTGGAA